MHRVTPQNTQPVLIPGQAALSKGHMLHVAGRGCKHKGVNVTERGNPFQSVLIRFNPF